MGLPCLKRLCMGRRRREITHKYINSSVLCLHLRMKIVISHLQTKQEMLNWYPVSLLRVPGGLYGLLFILLEDNNLKMKDKLSNKIQFPIAIQLKILTPIK